MATVVSFWRFPDEEREFLEFLQKKGNVVAIPYGNFHSKQEIIAHQLDKFLKDVDPDDVFLGLECHVEQIQISLYKDEQGDRFTASAMQSPLIGYKRGKYREGIGLSQSNLFAYWSYPSEDRSTMIDKPEEFIKWAKKVFQWVRDFTPEWHQYKGYRVTPRIAEAIRQQAIKVIP